MSQSSKPRQNQIPSFCFYQLIIERINQNPAVTGLDINSIKRKYRTPFKQLKDIIGKMVKPTTSKRIKLTTPDKGNFLTLNGAN